MIAPLCDIQQKLLFLDYCVEFEPEYSPSDTHGSFMLNGCEASRCWQARYLAKNEILRRSSSGMTVTAGAVTRENSVEFSLVNDRDLSDGDFPFNNKEGE